MDQAQRPPSTSSSNAAATVAVFASCIAYLAASGVGVYSPMIGLISSVVACCVIGTSLGYLFGTAMCTFGIQGSQRDTCKNSGLTGALLWPLTIMQALSLGIR